MIILHATASGNPALRDPQTGSSFFIEELCKQLKIPERRTIVQESSTLKFAICSISLFNLPRFCSKIILAFERILIAFRRIYSLILILWLKTSKIMKAVTRNLSPKIHKIVIDGQTRDFQMVPQYSACLRDDLIFFENKPDKSAIAG